MYDSLDFLIAWWPRAGQPTYLAAQTSSSSILTNQVEAASCFMGQCWKSSVTSDAFYRLWASPRPSDSRREYIDFISQWEECHGHSIAHRLGNVVTAIFGRYSLPQRAITITQIKQDKRRQKEFLWPLTLVHDIDTHRISFIYTKSAISSFSWPIDTLSYDGIGALSVRQQMNFGNGHNYLSFGQLFKYILSFTHIIWFLNNEWKIEKWIFQWRWWKGDGKSVRSHPQDSWDEMELRGALIGLNWMICLEPVGHELWEKEQQKDKIRECILLKYFGQWHNAWDWLWNTPANKKTKNTFGHGVGGQDLSWVANF